MMFVHWQARYEHVIAELSEEDARKLVADLESLTYEAGYSTRLVETLLASVKEELKHAGR
jgi:hypothetical protein